MKHTWEFVRRSETYDHPCFFEMSDIELRIWANCRGVFKSRQTGETTHRKIKTKNTSYHTKRFFGLTHEQAL